jgi:regulation of enolase protein 1 (concanavalin A-like superfamily)
MSESHVVHLPGVPGPAHWAVEPQSWAYDPSGALTITAGSVTDLFADPAGGASSTNAPRLLFTLDGDFTLAAKVTVAFGATYDAGVLLLFLDEARWAKLCFERSPQGVPTVVSVVTLGSSDDCNGPAIEGSTIWLRVARLGQAFAFHWSVDSSFWHLARYFTLGKVTSLHVGFSAQSPTGAGCAAQFEQITYGAERVRELRDGS